MVILNVKNELLDYLVESGMSNCQIQLYQVVSS